VFRPAIIANAAAIVVMHNHPSGDATPSDADIKVTRD
jgi:DNA repair protein RadC